MAFSVATVFQGQNMYIGDVTWGADGDLTGDIPHGLTLQPGTAPAVVIITPQAMTAATTPVGATVVDATKVTVTRVGTGAGAGAASAVRVVIWRPHSIIR